MTARGKNLARELAFHALRLSMVPWVIRRTVQRRSVTLLAYHDPDPETMERHLRALRRRYSVIDLRSFIDSLDGNGDHSLPPRALVVTIDDGHRGNLRLLPVVERLRVPVTIFLCAGIVGTTRRYWWLHSDERVALKLVSDQERLARLESSGFRELGDEREALSDEEVRRMAGPFVDFQSHGLSHPILPACDDEKARAEVSESKRVLAERYGFDVYAFSYPNGDYSERELRLVRDAGYRCALTAQSGFNNGASDRFCLKRIVIADTDSLAAVIVKASGLWGAIRHAALAARRRPAQRVSAPILSED